MCRSTHVKLVINNFFFLYRYISSCVHMQSSVAHNVINERKKNICISETLKISLSRWLSSSVDNSTEPLGRKKKTKKIVFFNVYKLDARGDDE